MENSRLNMLPGELRNRIYRFALVSGVGISFDMSASGGEFNTIATRAVARGALNLLSTCKQIRAEALPIYFVENPFEFTTNILLTYSASNCISRAWRTRVLMAGWLSTIGPSARHIQHPVIDVGRWRLSHPLGYKLSQFLPDLLKGLKTSFLPMKTTVVWRLNLMWSRIGNERLTLTFWDAASARHAFEEVFNDGERVVSDMVAEYKLRGYDIEGKTALLRADLAESRIKTEVIITALESMTAL